MAERPVFHQELGRFFVALREALGWTQRQTADIASRRKLLGVSRQVVMRLEKGKTKNIDPIVLRSLAKLYEEPYESIAARFIAARYGLVVQGSATETFARKRGTEDAKGTLSILPEGSLGATTSARALTADDEEAINKIAEAAKTLIDLATDIVERTEALGGQVATSRPPPPARPPHHRRRRGSSPP